MKIEFIGIGKTRHGFLQEGIDRYKKLLTGMATLKEHYLKEESEKRPDCLERESDKLLKNIPGRYHRVLLDIDGVEMNSEKLSLYIKDLRDKSVPGLVFIIGGSNGVDNNLRSCVDLRLSFSKMTFTHRMIRLFLAEQIYRAFSIMNNKSYHK
ncbi:MAG: 23S rRNA (pseudouridine(1915)-N(3))-methyltransferase RlmH [Candidatus Delongbacteria bacterium]